MLHYNRDDIVLNFLKTREPSESFKTSEGFELKKGVMSSANEVRNIKIYGTKEL